MTVHNFWIEEAVCKIVGERVVDLLELGERVRLALFLENDWSKYKAAKEGR